jgi:polysaccharide biosynthesis transport protein
MIERLYGRTRAPAPIAVPDVRPVEPPSEEDEITLRELWSVIVKRRWSILLFILLAAAAAAAATYHMTPIYRASLTLQIDGEDRRVARIEEVAGGTILGSDQDYYRTQYDLLRSRSLAQRVVTELGLADRPPEPPALLDRILAPIRDGLDWVRAVLTDWLAQPDPAESEGPPPTEAELLDRAIDRAASELLGNLTVEGGGSRLVRLHYTSADPRHAVTVLDALASSYINLNLERRFEATAYARDFLQERLAQIKSRQEELEREMVTFAREKEIITIGDNQTIVTQRLAAANAALSAATQRRATAEAAYRQMRGARDQEGLSQVLDSEIIQALKLSKVKLEAEHQESLRRYTSTHPDMAQLRAQLAQIDRQIAREVALIREMIIANHETAKAEEALLRANLELLQRDVLEQQDRGIQFNILRREADINNELYKTLLQRFKEVGVAAGIGPNNISIVDPARAPAWPFKPNPRRNVLLALVLGVLGGIGLAFLREYLDDTFKDPDDLERRLHLPVLGLIPRISQKRGDLRSIALVGHENPRSVFAESYRSLRTALEFSTSSGVPRVLTVTSATSGEGKSTTALSLAIQFAQTGRQVLLIDADLREPSLHHALNLDNHFGLTNLLAGDQERTVNIAHPTHIPNLFVIPAGPLPPNPAELLSGAKMLGLLVLAAEKFDQVLLDSPPIMGLADALILGNLCDGALLTVAMGGATRGQVQVACKRLRGARLHLVGTVLNKFKVRSGGTYGYYHGHDHAATTLDGKKLST